MMDVRRTHFNRSALLAAIAIATAAGDSRAQLPERVRATPVIVGSLTYNRTPIAGAKVAAVLREAGQIQPQDGCGSPTYRTTSDSGTFRLSEQWKWLDRNEMEALRRGAPEMRHLVFICLQMKNEQRFRVVYQAPALRWDTLHVSCELGRAWLTPDREGRQGYCETGRSVVNGVHLAERSARDRLPDVTCDTTNAVISRLRIGPVRAMGSLEQLQRLCPSLRDTSVKGEGWLEMGFEQRAMVLTVANTPVLIHPQAGVSALISVRTPGIKTADGIGVGTPANRIAAWQNLFVVAGSTDVLPYALAWTGEECGTGFYFTQPTMPKNNERRFVTPDELRSWPDSFRITRIVVGMCPQYMYLEKHQPKRDTLQRTR